MSAPATLHAAFCLAEEVQALFPAGVTVAVTDPRAEHPLPFAVEARAVARARPARRREFAAGRAAIHRAMSLMGLAPVPVPMGHDRAPLWPEGLTGSLTHSADLCLAGLARSAEIAALGLDAEPDAPLEPALWPEICTLAERAWLARQPAAERGRLAGRLFVAKEAAYKCQYAQSRALIGFHDLEIAYDPESGRFEARLLVDVPGHARGTCLAGRQTVSHGHVIAATALPARPANG